MCQQMRTRGLHVCLRRDKEASPRAGPAFPSFCALPPPNAVSAQSLPLALIPTLQHHEVLILFTSFSNSRNVFSLCLKYLSLFRSMLRIVFKEVGSWVFWSLPRNQRLARQVYLLHCHPVSEDRASGTSILSSTEVKY